MSTKNLDSNFTNNDQNSIIANSRFQYIDILRVISMVFVIFLHTLAGSLRGNIGSLTWHVSNLLMTFMCTAVPIFFMISGAVLLNSKKTASISITLKKRLPKVFIPFIVWSFVSIIYFIVLQHFFVGTIDWAGITYKLKHITQSSTTVHLWFLYVLIPIYILSPIFKKAIDALETSHIKYLLIIWFLFSSFFPTVASLVPEGYKTYFMFNSVYGLNFMDGYLGFFFLGYFILNLKRKFSKKMLVSIIIIDSLVIYFGAWWKTIETGNFDGTFNTYSRVFTLVLSVAIFLLVKEIMRDKVLSKKFGQLISVFSSLSFGIYLIHNLLVDLLSNKINLYPAYSVQLLFFSVFVVFCISSLAITFLASIKPLCYAFTGLDYSTACKTCNLTYYINKIKNSSFLK